MATTTPRSPLAALTNLDEHEREYLDAKRGVIPDDELADNIRQYRVAKNYKPDAESDGPYDPRAVDDPTRYDHTPSLDEFLAEAKPLNKGVPENQLISFWSKNFGHVDDPKSLPTYDDFLKEAKPLNPDRSEADLKEYWQAAFGDRGARESHPGFGESILSGVKQGFYGLGTSAAGTVERLQDTDQPLKKMAHEAGDALEKTASQYAPSPELAQQPWYQRLTDKEYLGNLIGNVAVQSAPSLAGAVVGGVIGGPAGAAAGMIGVTYFQQAGSTYRDAYQRYKADGLGEQVAHEKAYQDSGIAGLVSGVVNALAIPASLVAPFTGTLKNLALQYVLNVAVDTGDQATQNVVAKATFKPEQTLTEGIPEAVVGSGLLSAPETMTAVKSIATGPAKTALPPEKTAPVPMQNIPAALGITDPDITVDDAIAKAAEIVAAKPDKLSQLSQRMADNAAVVSGERLPTQEEAARLSTRTPQQVTETPILPGAEPQETPLIQPGQAFTPRQAQEPDARAAIQAERERILGMRKVPRGTTEPVGTEGIIAPVPTDKPLPTAAEKAYPSVDELHRLAESKGLQWDNNPVFMEMTKQVTGKAHLDDLTPQERQTFADRLQKMQGTAALPATKPQKATPQPVEVPAGTPATEPLSIFEAAQVPRSELSPEQNAEMLARAEKAQADVEIAGRERGTRTFLETQGTGSTQEVTGLKSATADWYKDATTGPMKLSRERVDTAIAKIIEDKGRDTGRDVQRIKELLLQDREFMSSGFAPKTDADWAALHAVATGQPDAATIDQAAHVAATSPKNELPEPTPAQAEAVNYQLGHTRIAGLEISIEHPEGSTRSGKNAQGTPWSITMADHYGYIRGTKGKDKDQIDVYLKPGTPDDYSGPVFIVDQNKPGTTEFDEHKVIMGVATGEEARDLYLRNFKPGWTGLRSIKPYTMREFKLWLQVGNKQKPAGTALPPTKTPEAVAQPELDTARLAQVANRFGKGKSAQGRQHADDMSAALRMLRKGDTAGAIARLRQVQQGSYAQFPELSNIIGEIIGEETTAPETKTETPKPETEAPKAETTEPTTTDQLARFGVKTSVDLIGTNVQPTKASGLGPKNAGKVTHVVTDSAGRVKIRVNGTGPHWYTSDFEPQAAAAAAHAETPPETPAPAKEVVKKFLAGGRGAVLPEAEPEAQTEIAVPTGDTITGPIKIIDASQKDDLIKRLKNRLGKPSTAAEPVAAYGETGKPALDPKTLADVFQLGAIYLQEGIRDYATWSGQMREVLGPGVKDYLRPAWSALKAFPKDLTIRPNVVASLTTYANTLFQKGVTDYTDFTAQLVKAFGSIARPYADALHAALDTYANEEAEPEPELTPAERESRKVEASREIAQKVKNALDEYRISGEPLTREALFKLADEAFGGTQAAGTYTPKEAFDAMELGVNLYIASFKGNNFFNPVAQQAVNPDVGAKTTIERIRSRILNALPSQAGLRTDEQNEFQQFSTPPDLAFAMNWAANLTAKDVVLEPSAGLGGLAVFAKNAGATTIVNELHPRRAALLAHMGFSHFLSQNAEQLNNVYPKNLPKPTVVVMNPPFSSTAGRITGERKGINVVAHIDQALKLLEDGGRLVVLIGDHNLGRDRPSGIHGPTSLAEGTIVALMKLPAQLRATIRLSGEGYKKWGTAYGNRLLIYDKIPKTDTPPVTGSFAGISDAIPALLEVRNARHRAETTTQPATTPAESGSEQVSPPSTGGTGPVTPTPVSTPPVGTEQGGPDVALPGRGSGTVPTIPGTPGSPAGPTGGVQLPPSGSKPGTRGTAPGAGGSGGTTLPTGGRGPTPGRVPGRTDSGSELGAELPADDRSGVTLDTNVTPETPTDEITDSLYEDYTPQKLRIEGAKPHPGRLVQSAAMASTEPPDPTYTPNLPKELITSGKLSIAQLEPIVGAGQAHQSFLPNGERLGYFIGDGTGVGKGREIAGIILDNFRQGRKKAIWISEKANLLESAIRDWTNLDQSKDVFLDHGGTGSAETLPTKNGIMFSRYSMIASGSKIINGQLVRKDAKSGKVNEKMASRLEQLIAWAGPNFDGVIAFDESHNMNNTDGEAGERGQTDPSARALAANELQRRLPKARIVYVSATGAKSVATLVYAERLGLWGDGTPFPDKKQFIGKIEAGGLGAMEMVARDLKADGKYISRSLDYSTVTYEQLEHELNDKQKEIYDTMAGAWQTVLQNIDAALELTGVTGPDRKGNTKTKNGAAKGVIMGQFWSSEQRFFQQVLTSLAMPSTLASMKKAVADGKAIVVQLVNTYEASQERQLSKMAREGADLESLDLTPREDLMEYIRKGFPVNQYEDYADAEGKIKSRLSEDADGNPIENREAVALRDALLAKIADPSFSVPDSPIDQILNALGPENVAEITGRSRRVIRRENGTMEEQKRSRTIANAEVKQFKDDKRRALIFSDAGGTGESYDSDRTFKNQRQRYHYVVQPGWIAQKVIQGLGRTHRSNEANSPHVILTMTNVKGHRRFISTVARGLDAIGAVTQGQRQTGSSGLIDAKNNLENIYGSAAVRSLFEDLVRGQVVGKDSHDAIDNQGVLERMGLKEIKDQTTGGVIEGKMPTVKKFLNRIMTLTLDEQNAVFDEFYRRMERATEEAAAAGTLDVGMETYRADAGITVRDEQIARTDERSGAKTLWTTFEAKHTVHFVPFAEAAKGRPGKVTLGFYQNKKSGQVWSAERSYQKTLESGAIVNMLRLQGPVAGQFHSIESGNLYSYDKLTNEAAEPLWKKEIEDHPEHRTEVLNMVSGALLKIWDRLPATHARIMRLQTTDNTRYLGRIILNADVKETKKNLGVGAEKITASPAELVDKVLKGGAKLSLENGWKIKRSLIQDEPRLELTGDLYGHRDQLERAGIFWEIRGSTTRYFLPTGAKSTAAMTALTKFHAVVEIDEGSTVGEAILPYGDQEALAAQLETQPEKKGKSQRATSIETMVDVGEKIGGARKDRWADRGLTLADLEGMTGGEEAKFITKQNIWRPNYADMVKNGTDPKAAALLKIFYDRLGTKPRVDTPDGRRAFVKTMGRVKTTLEGVKTVKDVTFPEDWDNNLTYEERRAVIPAHKRSFGWYVGYSEQRRAERMVEDGFPNQEPWQRVYKITELLRPRTEAEKSGVIENNSRREFAGIYARRLLQNQKSERWGELIKTIPEFKDQITPINETEANTDVLVKAFMERGIYDVRHKGSGANIGYLAGEDNAKEFARQTYETDSEAADEGPKMPERPHLDTLEREGPEYRTGDVTAEDFRDTFGFRGVEFGNWAASDERQKHVNQAYDALNDLADLLGIPNTAISLNGTLGLAFGARGSGKAAAHYESSKLVINITKLSGPGSLAHEWGHALDHYFGEVDHPQAYTGEPHSVTGWREKPRYGVQNLTNIRAELREKFQRLTRLFYDTDKPKADAVRQAELAVENQQAQLEASRKSVAGVYDRGDVEINRRYLKQAEEWIPNAERRLETARTRLAELRGEPEKPGSYGTTESSFYKAAETLSGPTGDYWKRPTELFARSFEAYVYDKLGRKSQYLVHSVADTTFGAGYKANPYPAGLERKAINQAYDDIFSTIEFMPTEKGMKLFEAPKPYGQQEMPVPPPTIGERPIIGREPAPGEAPLFEKSAQEPDPEQGTLFERKAPYGEHPFRDVVALPFVEGVPSKEKVAQMREWLRAHNDLYKNDYTVMYHGTGTSLPIMSEGLRRTSENRRRSFQSKSGYVYLANTPERARTFGDLGNQSNAQVYAVRVLVRNLRADVDQLNNQRASGEDVGNSLAESIVYGGGARYAQDILPGDIAPLGQASIVAEGLTYALRPGEQAELNYDLARAALSDLNQAGTDVSTTTGAIDRVRGDVRTVALGITPDLIHQGVVDLTGYAVTSAEDLAKLAQVYRDPRFETSRVIYLKGEQIVGHEGVTSRMPGFVMVFRNNADREAKLAAMQEKMDALGADGYYLLHNHPSGNSKPSREDFELTRRYAETVPGFKGHVVIDSNQYHLINAEFVGSFHPLDLGQDKLLTPSMPHPLLGSTIETPGAAASVARALKTPEGFVTVLYRASNGQTRAIQEVSTEFLSDPNEAGEYLREQAVAFGGPQVFTHYVHAGNKENLEGLRTSVDRLIDQGILLDHITEMASGFGGPMSRHMAGVTAKPGMFLGRSTDEIPSELVAEPSAPYVSTRTATDTGRVVATAALGKLSAAKTSARPYLLGALGLDQLATVYGKDHAEVDTYNSASQQMEADFTEMTRLSDATLKRWDKLKIPVADRMARVMEDARLANFDADQTNNELQPSTVDQRELTARFDQLPEEAKAVYREVRDFYSNMAEKRFDAIRARIQRSGGTEENRRALLDRLHLAYDKVRAKVYFPFSRFGEHIVIAKKMQNGKEIDREVRAFESPGEAGKFATMMKARGWTVKQTLSKQYSREQDGAASTAVREILDVIDGLTIDTTVVGTVTPKQQLKDAINQTFLHSLPDMSYAKHFIHAKDVKGFSKDALRAFAHSALHGAHHISRINNADFLTGALTAMDERINETPEGDVTEARQVYNELILRHNAILNPDTHPVAAWLGQLGFTMSLGGVLATGVTNMTQVPLITLPWLGARYGFGKSTAALGKAYKDFLDPKTLNTDSLFDASESTRLTAPERAMLKELQKRGRIDLTQTMDLSGRASQDNLSRVAKQTGTIRGKITKMLGFTFHAPEVMNRQVTALATYRLALARGESESAAIEQAEHAIIDTHFIYTQENRPRYMSGNVLRVLTMFKQYSQNIAFLYGRASQVWLDKNGATPEERKVAKRQLLSMTALQFAAAGALGMPFVGTIASLVTSILNGFGDDDDKKDWEVELRKLLAEQFGKEAGEVLAHGASRLTPWDMSARLGQSDLFFRAPQREREGRAAAMDWVTSFAGPVLGYAVNAYLGTGDVVKGIKDADAGHFLRGVEELTPSVIRHGVRSLRYELEGGVRTRDLHKQMDVSYAEKLGQFFGFAPARAAEMYEGVNAIKNTEHHLTQRRSELLDRYAAAYQDRDQAERLRVLEEVRAFNKKYPYVGISGDTLMKSLRGRVQRERGTNEGVYLPRRREPLRERGSFANF